MKANINKSWISGDGGAFHGFSPFLISWDAFVVPSMTQNWAVQAFMTIACTMHLSPLKGVN